MTTFTCPVCDYSELVSPPEDHSICPRCGTEFEYDDITLTFGELREEWESDGSPFSPSLACQLNARTDELEALCRKLPKSPVIEITCDQCRHPLTELGALMFSPPNADSTVKKFHICVQCYKNLFSQFLHQNRNSINTSNPN